MRKPREPRAPRAPREDAASAGAAGAIPPRGFSVPVRGFQFGPMTGPQPPRRIGTQASAPSAPSAPHAYAPALEPPAPAYAAPPAAAPATGFDMPPAGPAIAAAATNDFAEVAATRGYWQSRSTRRAQPQGETQLVHAWLHILTVQRIPPNACTIWLTRVDPQPTYDLYIPGEAIVGEFPDRSLYEYVSRNRRQRDVAERFVGRIRAPADNGSPCELGGGELYLPPAQAAAPIAPGPAWSQPGAGYPYGNAAPPPGYPGMMPPWMPPGGMPWWAQGGGSPPGMMPPWWGPSAPPLSALMAAHQPPPPPAVVQQDPAAMRAWEMMSQNQSTLLRSVLELAARPPQTAPIAPAAPDMWETLDRVVGVMDKLRGPPAPDPEPRVSIIKVDDETTLITGKDGSIDAGATAWANIKGLKGIAASLGNLRRNPAQGPGPGPQPPRRNILAPAGTPPKPNGAAS